MFPSVNETMTVFLQYMFYRINKVWLKSPKHYKSPSPFTTPTSKAFAGEGLPFTRFFTTFHAAITRYTFPHLVCFFINVNLAFYAGIPCLSLN